MAITDLERFSAYPAVFDAVTLADVVNITPSAEIKQIIQMAAGALDPGAIAMIARDPRVALSVCDLSVLSDISATVGLAIGTSAKIQYQARTDGGTFASGSSHFNMTGVKGFLLPESISAQQDDTNPALLQLMYYGLKSGANPALTINSAVALSGSPGISNLYKLGPVVIDGDILGGVQRSQVNFGLNYQTKRANGDIDPTVGSIVERRPTAEISADNLSLAKAANYDLIACSTSIVIYYLLIGGTSHVSITFPAGSTYQLTDVPAQGTQDAETRLKIDAVGDVLTINTAAAYPT